MKKIFAANWKMFIQSEKDAIELLDVYKEYDAATIIFPSSLHYYLTKNGKFNFGGQDCSEHIDWQHTGEISATQLANAGATHVIIGHSERRKSYDNELTISKKIENALTAGLQIILCIGENERSDKADHTIQALSKQLNTLEKFSDKIIVAYEPVWAIGTGVTPEICEIEQIISMLKQKYNNKILYGGSVSAKNIEAIIKLPVVDGVLVGSASTRSAEINAMLKFFI